MLHEEEGVEYVMITDANSFIAPQEYPQINTYLRGFAMSHLARVNNSVILIRIHTVGKNTEQLFSFESGLNAINRKYPNIFKSMMIHYLNNDIVRCNHMTPSDVVTWLLGGHIHILLGHFHQGIQYI